MTPLAGHVVSSDGRATSSPAALSKGRPATSPAMLVAPACLNEEDSILETRTPPGLNLNSMDWVAEDEQKSIETASSSVPFKEGLPELPSLSTRDALRVLVDAPPYVQDVCALTRRYAVDAEKTKCFCYAPMRELWAASEGHTLHTANPRWQKSGDFLQYLLQVCVLLMSRPDLTGTSHHAGVRSGALFLAAILLATQPDRPGRPMTRVRLTAAGAAAVRAAGTLSPDCAFAAEAVLRSMDAVASLRHGPAHLPLSLATLLPHPAVRRWPQFYDVDAADAARVADDAADDWVRPVIEMVKREREDALQRATVYHDEVRLLEIALEGAIEQLNSRRINELRENMIARSKELSFAREEFMRLEQCVQDGGKVAAALEEQ